VDPESQLRSYLENLRTKSEIAKKNHDIFEDFNISMKIQRDSVTATAAGNEKIQIVTRRGS